MHELAGAIRDYQAATDDRVTIAWVLLGGVNHDDAEVEAYLEQARGLVDGGADLFSVRLLCLAPRRVGAIGGALFGLLETALDCGMEAAGLDDLRQALDRDAITV